MDFFVLCFAKLSLSIRSAKSKKNHYKVFALLSAEKEPSFCYLLFYFSEDCVLAVMAEKESEIPCFGCRRTGLDIKRANGSDLA